MILIINYQGLTAVKLYCQGWSRSVGFTMHYEILYKLYLKQANLEYSIRIILSPHILTIWIAYGIMTRQSTVSRNYFIHKTQKNEHIVI